MTLEAVLLTGGASSRMGRDKAGLLVDGVSLAERTLAEFDRIGVPVTVLGQSPIVGRAFLRDEQEHAGPASALSRFVPTCTLVFVASCDMPCFHAEIPVELREVLGERDAVIPYIEGRSQYLCALYRSHAFPLWRCLVQDGGTVSMRDLVGCLNVRTIEGDELRAHGIDPGWLASANTITELRSLLGGDLG